MDDSSHSANRRVFADWSLRYEKLVWMLTPTYKHNWGSFLSLGDNRPQEAEFCQREMKTWHPDLSQVETDGGDESSKEWRILGLMHTAVSVSLLSCTSDRLQHSLVVSFALISVANIETCRTFTTCI
jgi:hypothetical protein